MHRLAEGLLVAGIGSVCLTSVAYLISGRQALAFFVVENLVLLAVLIVMKRWGFIHSVSKWQLLSLGTLVLTLFCTQYLWVNQFPTGESRDEYSFDAATYDYYASEIAKSKENGGAAIRSFDRAPSAWGYYMSLGEIYGAFGDITLIAGQINAVMLLIALWAMLGLLSRQCSVRLPPMLSASIFLVPELFYFSAIPAKDVVVLSLTVMFFVSFMHALLKNGRVRPFDVIWMAALLAIIYTVRPTELVMLGTLVCGLVFFYGLKTIRAKIYSVVAVAVALCIIALILPDSFSPLSTLQNILVSLVDIGEFHINQSGNAAESLSYRLIPHDLGEWLSFGLVRAAFLFLAPLPRPLAFMDEEGYAFYIQAAHSATTLILIGMIPYFVRGQRILARRNNVVAAGILAFQLLSIYVAGLASLFVHLRYRLDFTFIYFVVALIGLRGSPSRRTIEARPAGHPG